MAMFAGMSLVETPILNGFLAYTVVLTSYSGSASLL